MRRMILAVAALAIVATACGAEVDKGSYADETKGPTAASSSTKPTGSLKPCPANAVTVSKDTAKDLTKKPRLIMKTQGCGPPATLVKTDLVVGTGAVVKEHATVKAQYVGVGFDDRKQFDASWDNGGQAIEFSLDGVIPGWTQGIPGMRVGGRRLLIIPVELAYSGAPGKPGGCLIFVVDITAAK